ncbi:MAG: Hsp20 family protein [Anaerolineae bacterium]|nr:Hsp20 family protein [Anaerolineae bacterium]
MLMRPYRSWRSYERDMRRLRRDMNRLFAGWPARAEWSTAPGFPAMNAWTNEDSAVVTAELPGVGADDIEIAVEKDTLTLRGRREPEELEEGASFHRRERRFGGFNRAFRLPFAIDAAEVKAEFKNGLLTIVLPRAEADKPKTIAITSG